jgi:glycosyltransferase 2 family protein
MNHSVPRCDIQEPVEQTGSATTAHGRLAAGGAAFLLLTLGIFWYLFHRIQAGDATPRWADLRWGYLVFIILCLPIETLASGSRIWVISRVLEPGISYWACIKSEWANAGLSILTPSHAGGGAGQVYILSRSGTSVGTALTITLLSFVGTMVALSGMGVYTLVVSGLSDTGPLFLAAVWSILLITAALGFAATCPGVLRTVLGAASRAVWRLRGAPRPLVDWWPPGQDRTGAPADRMDSLAAKLADIVYTYRDDVARFLRAGKMSFVLVSLLSFAFLLARAFLPYLCLRFLGIEASSVGRIVETQMALVFLIFFAPTPGGAGLAESASLSVMANIVPDGFAPHYNLLWRVSTAYLAATAGLICLARALAEEARNVLHHRREPS